MANRLGNRVARDFSAVTWLNYFDEAHDVSVNTGDTFRVYLKNFQPPYAPKRKLGTTISEPVQIEVSENRLHSQTPTLVTLHGGGYSGLTWAQFSLNIQQQCECRVLSMDLRGHGDTITDADDRMDIDTLVDDVVKVIRATHQLCGFLETPKIVLIGHSMGGAIAVKCSYRCAELLPTLVGFVIIDVVEGTAKEALPMMISVIQTRPTRFPSLENAIEWSVRSGMAKNIDAARVSMPSNLLNIETGYLGIHDIKMDDDEERRSLSDSITKHKFHINLDKLIDPHRAGAAFICLPKQMATNPRLSALRSCAAAAGFPRMSPLDGSDSGHESCPTLAEGAPDSVVAQQQQVTALDDEHIYKKPHEVEKTGYCWRTDLAKTQLFWNGWFDGLSEQMLAAPVQGKFLLLAGIDRLDKTLTIGQMQGKFMMKVLPKCGHAVHEDVPHQVASVIGQFLVRHKFASNTNETGANNSR